MWSDAERGKFTLTYDAKPYKIVSKKGSIITQRREGTSFDVPNDPTKEKDDENLKMNLPSANSEKGEKNRQVWNW